MWISQSYIGYHANPATRVYMYFLFEEYVDHQEGFRNAIEKNLEKLGEKVGSDAQIFLPNPRAIKSISRELDGKFNGLVQARIQKGIPGIFFSKVPLQDLDIDQGRWVFVGLKALKIRSDKDPDIIPAYFVSLEKIIIKSKNILHDIANLGRQKFSDIIKIKLGFSWNGTGVELQRFDDPFIESNSVLG